MKKIVLFLPLLFIFCFSIAQHKYNIGLEGGLLYQRYSLNDPDGYLQKNAGYGYQNGIGAIAFQVNLPHHLLYKISAGFYAINYDYGMFQNDTYYNGIGQAENFFAMANIGYRLPVFKKLSVVPMAGLALNVNNSYDESQGYWGSYSTGIEYNSEFPPVVFPTGNTSIELQYAAGKRISLMLSGNYMIGFTNRAEHNISYKIRNGPMHFATMSSRGSFLYFAAGVRYGFSKISF